MNDDEPKAKRWSPSSEPLTPELGRLKWAWVNASERVHRLELDRADRRAIIMAITARERAGAAWEVEGLRVAQEDSPSVPAEYVPEPPAPSKAYSRPSTPID